MNINGPVIIIEDDPDDQEMLTEAFKQLPYKNDIKFFSDGEAALAYLNQTHVIPFVILSDINLPKLDGFALRNKIKTDAALQIKCIPYIFFSTASNQRAVIDAYSTSVQGFFVKKNTLAELKQVLAVIMEYWLLCEAPNRFPERLI
ncbi:MAG: response regulator [Flavisolibacter sp.]